MTISIKKYNLINDKYSVNTKQLMVIVRKAIVNQFRNELLV